MLTVAACINRTVRYEQSLSLILVRITYDRIPDKQ